MSKQHLKNVDRFSFFAGLVGLVADFITLGSLFLVSKSSQDSSFFLWVVVLAGLVYSIAIINFYFRKKIHSVHIKSLGDVFSSI